LPSLMCQLFFILFDFGKNNFNPILRLK